ncbi:protein-L-isoaspartate(D-aspartate) O-methyltransferase [Nonomuraea sp. NPDC050404]|uniref:protein-L-isoaspartate(D-aspartate) O-methyltransferase n=1 Tax=Nonomuraea sp. NPDC050404 TaxID=3155783 RepID=UPI0033E7CD93
MGTLSTRNGRSVERLIVRLAEDLRARGALTDPRWERALHEVPRHLFVPDAAWFTASDARAPRGRFAIGDDPAAWLEAVYSDTSVIIQTDDGAGDPTSGTGTFSSSVSAPGIVFPFLELLDPREGERILEIGAGSGWTAALLSWAAGDGGVTSIEIDPEVGARAVANLAVTGFSPKVVIGDGVKGWPERAPYDGMHVTAGVTDIPMAWIEQTRPGGVIVMPWHGNGMLGHRLRLVVADDATATGRFHGTAGYMMLREQRYNTRWSSHRHEEATETKTRINPRTIAATDPGAHLMAAALAPRIAWHAVQEDTGYSLHLYELDDHDRTGSWAACDHELGGDEARVTQYGPRRLWDELSSAYRQWVSLGSPSSDRFGMTVDPQGIWLWLDHPAGPTWRVPV